MEFYPFWVGQNGPRLKWPLVKNFDSKWPSVKRVPGQNSKGDWVN